MTPCPICGHPEPIIVERIRALMPYGLKIDDPEPEYHVECPGCHFRTQQSRAGYSPITQRTTSAETAKARAVARWNTRSAPRTPPAAAGRFASCPICGRLDDYDRDADHPPYRRIDFSSFRSSVHPGKTVVRLGCTLCCSLDRVLDAEPAAEALDAITAQLRQLWNGVPITDKIE